MMNLMLGDCLERMKEIPDGSVDMILCDLPYGSTRCHWDSVIPFEPLWAEYKRIAKPNAAIVLTGSQPFTSALVMSNVGMFKYDWIWKKAPFNFLNVSHQPLRNSENISVFYSKKPTYKPVEKDLIKWKTHGGKNRKKTKTVGDYNVIDGTVDGFAKPTTIIEGIKKEDTRKIKHPTQKPVALMEYLIRTYTNEGETVLDNCMGSGTTGVACVTTGRKFIGIEQDAGYFAIAQERIRAAGGDV